MKKKEFQNLPSTETPINAENLNEMQSNIEESCVIVSPIEPTTNEKVWIQKGKNLLPTTEKYWKQGTMDGTTGIEQSNSFRIITKDYISLKPDTDYTLSISSDFWIINGVIFDEKYNYIDSLSNLGLEYGMTSFSFRTPTNAKYIKIYVSYPGFENIVIEPNAITSAFIQLEQGAEATEYEAYIEPVVWLKNDNGVFEPFYKKSEIDAIKDILDEDTTEENQVQIDNVIFKKRGRTVYVEGWFVVNGTSKEIAAPYKPRNDMWIPVVGISDSLEPKYLGFITFLKSTGLMNIRLSGASTYATTGFSYLV